MYLCEHCWIEKAKHTVEVKRHKRVGMCEDCHAEATSFDVLELDQIKALNTDDDCSGVYFLWDRDVLQYIGQSMCIGNRINDHSRAYNYGTLRSSPTKQIKFDKVTCLPINDKPYLDAKQLDKVRNWMLIRERAYIEKYRPPFNTEWFL